jgi:hypothetical protein
LCSLDANDVLQQSTELEQLYRYAAHGEVKLTLTTLSGASCTIHASAETTIQQVKDAVEKCWQIPCEDQRIVAGVVELTDADCPACHVLPMKAPLTIVRVLSFATQVRTALPAAQMEMLRMELLPHVTALGPERLDEVIEELLERHVDEVLMFLGSEDAMREGVRRATRMLKVRDGYGAWR